jgi:hypothetical protein
VRTLAIVFVAGLLIVPPADWGQTLGLVATPGSVSFTVPAGVVPPSQVVNISFNGSPVAINEFSYSQSTGTTGQNWLQVSLSGADTLILNATSVGFSGNISTVVIVTTTVGTISVPVNLIVGAALPPAAPAPPTVISTLTGLAAAALYRVRKMFTRPRGSETAV